MVGRRLKLITSSEEYVLMVVHLVYTEREDVMTENKSGDPAKDVKRTVNKNKQKEI